MPSSHPAAKNLNEFRHIETPMYSSLLVQKTQNFCDAAWTHSHAPSYSFYMGTKIWQESPTHQLLFYWDIWQKDRLDLQSFQQAIIQNSVLCNSASFLEKIREWIARWLRARLTFNNKQTKLQLIRLKSAFFLLLLLQLIMSKNMTHESCCTQITISQTERATFAVEPNCSIYQRSLQTNNENETGGHQTNTVRSMWEK